jgi:hypothetical protein
MGAERRRALLGPSEKLGLYGRFKGSAAKAMKGNTRKSLCILSFASLIGLVDGLQAKYFTIGDFGAEAGVMYQLFFMIAAGTVAFWGLHDRAWSTKRNLSNLLMAVPISMMADNVSIDVQTLRPYFLIIPKDEFLWRNFVFGHTFLSPIAYWVNDQTLGRGLIDGYIAAIVITAGYVIIQYLWSRSSAA